MFYAFLDFFEMFPCRWTIINSVQTCSLSGCKPVAAVSYLVTSNFLYFPLNCLCWEALPTPPSLFEAAAGRATSFLSVLVLLLGSTAHSAFYTHTLGDSSLLTWMRSEFISPLFQQVQHHFSQHHLEHCDQHGSLAACAADIAALSLSFPFIPVWSGSNCLSVSLFLWMPK